MLLKLAYVKLKTMQVDSYLVKVHFSMLILVDKMLFLEFYI